MRPDDEMAERQLERDLEREPVRDELAARRRANSLQRRCAFWASIETAMAPPRSASIVAIPCPDCRGPVFAPSDSRDERIECVWCGVQLVTRRDLAGVVSVERMGGAS